MFFSAASASCAKPAADECAAAFAAADYAKAAPSCAAQFDSAPQPDPKTGHRAAYALFMLGRSDETLPWVEKLRGTSSEASMLALAGKIHRDARRNDAALPLFERCVPLAREAADDRTLAHCLSGLADLAWQESRYGDSMRYAGEAMERAQKIGDRDLEGNVAYGLYTSYVAIGDLERAEAALEMSAVRLRPNDSDGRAYLRLNQGGLRVDRQQYALARDALNEALALAKPELDRRFFRSAYLNLTLAGLELGELDAAELALDSAWKYAEDDGEQEQALLYYFARLNLAKNELTEADKALDLAFGENPIPDWRWDLEYCRGLVAEKRGDEKAAIAAFERSIAVIEEMRRSLESDDLRASLEGRKRAPYDALFRLHARAGRAEQALEVAERSRARTFLDALHRASRAEPKLLPAAVKAPLFEAQGPAGSSAAKNRHVLAYYDSGVELWLLVLSNHKLSISSLGGSKELSELSDRFAADPGDRALAASLGARILPPAALPKAGELIDIVPDGRLAAIPFCALEISGAPLVTRNPTTLVPALSALRSRAPGNHKRVVIADAKNDLPEASKEAVEVASRLGAVAELGAKATRAALFESRGGEHLHVAAHSGVGAGGGFIELYDGTVDSATIIDQRIDPDLVFLASCASGATRRSHPWGSIGGAFLAAGSQAVIASLWSVEDRATRELVREFYRVSGGRDSARALAEAQRVMIQRGARVSDWASFVHLGVVPSGGNHP